MHYCESINYLNLLSQSSFWFDDKTGSPRSAIRDDPAGSDGLEAFVKVLVNFDMNLFYNPLISTTSPPAWVPIAYQLM